MADSQEHRRPMFGRRGIELDRRQTNEFGGAHFHRSPVVRNGCVDEARLELRSAGRRKGTAPVSSVVRERGTSRSTNSRQFRNRIAGSLAKRLAHRKPLERREGRQIGR